VDAPRVVFAGFDRAADGIDACCGTTRREPIRERAVSRVRRAGTRGAVVGDARKSS